MAQMPTREDHSSHNKGSVSVQYLYLLDSRPLLARNINPFTWKTFDHTAIRCFSELQTILIIAATIGITNKSIGFVGGAVLAINLMLVARMCSYRLGDAKSLHFDRVRGGLWWT